MENWKDVVGWEGKYQVSDHGNVRSLDRWSINMYGTKCFLPGKNLTTTYSHGYRRVKLRDYKRVKLIVVHRILAEAHIPNPENKPFVNHIDGVKNNNNISNLEWCTRLENADHASRTGLQKKGDQSPLAKLTTKIVLEMHELHSNGMKTPAIALKYGFHPHTVYQAMKGKSWKHLHPTTINKIIEQ